MPTLAEVRAQYPQLDGLDDNDAVDVLHGTLYSDLPRERVSEALGIKPPEAPKPKSGLIRRMLGDSAVSLAKGVVGVPEALVGMADLASGGRAGKAVQDLGVDFKTAKEMLAEHYSPEQKAANEKINQTKGFFPTIGAMLRNPSTIAQQAIESSPTMLPGAGVARGAMWLGLGAAEKAAVMALPAAERAAAVATLSKVGPVAGGAIGEGATAAGQNAEQVRQEDPNGTLTPMQSAILAASGVLTGGISRAVGGLAEKLGIGHLETMLAQGHLGTATAAGAAAGAKKGLVRKTAEGAGTEGMQEVLQSYQEQVGQNLAQGKPWDQGAAEAAAQGGMAGGLMGASGAAMSGSHKPAQATIPAPGAPPLPGVIAPQQADPRSLKIPEVGPMTRAVNRGLEAEGGMADTGTLPQPPAEPAPPAPLPQPTEDEAKALLAGANERAAELTAKAKGEKPAADGKGGKPGEFLTPAELAEQDFLKTHGGDATALHQVYTVPGAELPNMGGTFERTMGNIAQDADRARAEQAKQSQMDQLPGDAADQNEKSARVHSAGTLEGDLPMAAALRGMRDKSKGEATPSAPELAPTYRKVPYAPGQKRTTLENATAQLAPGGEVVQVVRPSGKIDYLSLPPEQAESKPGDILYASKFAAKIKAQQIGGDVVQLRGGFAVRLKDAGINQPGTPTATPAVVPAIEAKQAAPVAPVAPVAPANKPTTSPAPKADLAEASTAWTRATRANRIGILSAAKFPPAVHHLLVNKPWESMNSTQQQRLANALEVNTHNASEKGGQDAAITQPVGGASEPVGVVPAGATPDAEAPVQAASGSAAAAPVATAPSVTSDSFEHAGLKVKRIRVRSADGIINERWNIQTPENADREARGERQLGGDRLADTIDQARSAADELRQQAVTERIRQGEIYKQEAAQKAIEESRKTKNKGKTLPEIRADATLDRMVSDNGQEITRRAWVEKQLAAGDALTIEQEDKIKPMTRTQFNRASNEEQRAHDKRILAAGKQPVFYIGNYAVTKTEYDYAKSLSDLPAHTASDTTPQRVAKAPVIEQVTAPELAPAAPSEPTNPARPTELIELRKRLSVLRSLVKCLG